MDRQVYNVYNVPKSILNLRPKQWDIKHVEGIMQQFFTVSREIMVWMEFKLMCIFHTIFHFVVQVLENYPPEKMPSYETFGSLMLHCQNMILGN